MKRSERIGRVREALDGEERACAARFRAAEQRARDAEARLQELARYREEYRGSLAVRSRAGIGSTALRDFQAFMSRLDEALRQQAQILTRSRAEQDFERARWLDAAAQVKAVATVIERWRNEERREALRLEQRESDERASQNHRRLQESST